MIGFLCLSFLVLLSQVTAHGDDDDKKCGDNKDNKKGSTVSNCPTYELQLTEPTTYDHKSHKNRGGCSWGSKSGSGQYSSSYYCGEIVSFFIKINGNCVTNTVASFKLQLNSYASSSITGVGFTGIVGDPVIQTGDPSSKGNGKSAVSSTWSVNKALSNGGLVTVNVAVTDVEANEVIIVRVDAKICCNDGLKDPVNIGAKLISCGSSTSTCTCPKDITVKVKPYPKDSYCCDKDPCTIDKFNFGTDCGCTSSVKDCNDNYECTDDSCVRGVCVNTPNNYCSGLCTASQCVPGSTPATSPQSGCTPCECKTAADCTACDQCADVACTSGSCVYKPMVGKCPDKECQVAKSCDIKNGCSYVPKDCNDNIDCTYDSCNAGVCSNVPDPNYCPSHNTDPCQISTCGPNYQSNSPSGCVNTPIVCNDHKSCTIDTCDSTGNCVYTPDPSPSSPCRSLPYDDGVCKTGVCTLDPTTDPTGCTSITKDCKDTDPCTEDACSVSAGGCTHLPVSCVELDQVCSNTNCVPGIGCVATEIPQYCGAPNFCKVAYCTLNKTLCAADPTCDNDGCALKDKDCDDHDPCTVDSCDPVNGCVHATNQTICDDKLRCTKDTCVHTGRDTYTCNNIANIKENCNPVAPCNTVILCALNRDCEPIPDHTKCTNTTSCNPGVCTVDGCNYPDSCIGKLCGSKLDCDKCSCKKESTPGLCGTTPLNDSYCCIPSCGVKRNIEEEQENGSYGMKGSAVLVFILVSLVLWIM